MKVKGERFKYSFPALGVHGRTHQVEVWAEIIDIGTQEDPQREIEGLLRLKTSPGVNVIYLGRGKYQVAGTGEVIASDDPAAL